MNEVLKQEGTRMRSPERGEGRRDEGGIYQRNEIISGMIHQLKKLVLKSLLNHFLLQRQKNITPPQKKADIYGVIRIYSTTICLLVFCFWGGVLYIL